jgi:hypothetical protein
MRRDHDWLRAGKVPRKEAHYQHVRASLPATSVTDEATMTNNDAPSERTPELQFVWWETKQGEEAQVSWGQLAGSTHRLRIIVDQLETLASKSNINVALTELASHLENYFVYIYELRERALGFLNAIIHDDKKIRALKDKRQRLKASIALQEQVPTLIDPLAALLNLLDEEIKMRHTHTHEQFLNLVLDTGYDIFDPHDALPICTTMKMRARS